MDMFDWLKRAQAHETRTFAHIDWYIFAAALAISLAGLATMRSFNADNAYFERQTIWIALAIATFFITSMFEYSFLRRTSVIMIFYGMMISLLLLIFAFATITKGAQNRFDLGFLAFQPSDPAKIVLIMLLAKYFARRHIEIAHIRHILVSGAYAGILFLLVFFQPDLGSGIIVGGIWLGMVLVAGISWRHLISLFVVGAVVFALLWQFGLHEYQKQRIVNFIYPLSDIRGSGYNAYQSMIAVGSGEVLGKGVGYGTQSKLRFLPEYQTDFIFAAYAEEWGFVGALLLLGLFGILIVRILMIAAHGADNFDSLFGVGIAVYFISQFIVHVGMNIGVMPITGVTLPFMSYGGSHLLTEYMALGILMGLRRRSTPRISVRDETDRFEAFT